MEHTNYTVVLYLHSGDMALACLSSCEECA